MSNDLISRSALLEDFRNTITERSDTFDWLNMINRQPTAYDVDKVVERLQECIADTTDTETGAGARWAYKGAIKIIKAGGTNE